MPRRNRRRSGAIRGLVKERAQACLQDTTGSVMVEYTILLVAVAMSSIAAIASIGPPLVSRYQFMKMLIALPIP